MTFAALFLPVLAGAADALVFFGVCAASSAIAVKPAILAFHTRSLTLASAEYARATRMSVCSLTGVSFVGLCAGLTLTAGPAQVAHWGSYVAWASAYLFVQGLYLMEISVITWRSSSMLYGGTRIAYGFSSLVTSAFASYMWPTRASLIIASMVSLVVACLVVERSRGGGSVAIARRAAGSSWDRRYARRSLSVGWSSALSDASAQSLTLALPLMGGLGPFWAGSQRVIGGMGTVGQQVLAPPYEMQLAADLRAGGPRWRSIVLQQVLAGTALGIATVPLLLLSLRVADLLPWQDQPWVVVVTCAMGAASMAMSVCMKTALMLGHERLFSWWSTSRLVAVAAALVATRASSLALALGVISTVWSLLYVALVLVASRHQGRAAA